jgi:TRAP-type C4-dicarboxylate transport system permease small subunit
MLLSKVCKKIADAMLAVSIACLICAIAINAVEIAGRFAADHSLYWIQDVTQLFMMWFIFPGMVKVFYDKQDIVVDIFVGMMPKAVRRMMSVVASALVTLFCAVLSYQSYLYMMLNYKKKMFTSQIPTKYYLVARVVCIGIIALMSLLRTVELIRGKQKEGETV